MEEAGHAFHMIGSSGLPSAARVAAGIIKPVTGRWMTKSWRFDDFAPEAESFYADIEAAFSIKIYQRLPAIRFCLNPEDAKRAIRRSRNPRYAGLLEAFQEPRTNESVFRDTNGSIGIHRVAYVNLPLLIECLRNHYRASGRYEDTIFEHRLLEKDNRRWNYRGQQYDRVVFCEGSSLNQNPWFGDLPMTAAKGETLLCRSDELELEQQLYHHEKWLLPYPDGTFRIGATYDESDLSPEPSTGARKELSEAFDKMTAAAYTLKIIDQLAGIRPGTTDARPFLGAHPTEPGLYIFNGLGAKGASLAPALSHELLEHMFEDMPLDPEADIRRFI